MDSFRPPLGPGTTVLVVLAAALSLLWLYGRGLGGGRRTDIAAPLAVWQRLVVVVSRVAALVALAWILAGPSVYRAVTVTGQRPTVVLLADTSASMNEADVAADAASSTTATAEPRLMTRWQAVARYWLTDDLSRQIEQVAALRVVGFDAGTRPLRPAEARALVPAGRQTRLFEALSQIAAAGASKTSGGQPQPPAANANGEGPPAGVIVALSDGHDTQRADDPLLAQRLAARGWRVLAVPVGSRRGVRDLAVLAWPEADLLFEGQSTAIEATVTRSGVDQPAVRVDLFHEGRRIDSQVADFGDQAAARVRFPIRPTGEPGQPVAVRGYQVIAEALEGERFTDNNARWVFVQVQRERIKVALFEGQPYWDTRFLAQVLRDDAQVDLTAVYGLGPGRSVVMRSLAGREVKKPAETDPAALTGAQLNDFDVVILGKGVERWFGGQRAQLLVDYVRDRGGALVLARGPAFDEADPAGREAARVLEAVEPVTFGRQMLADLGVQVTPQGRASPLLSFDQVGATDAVVTRLPDMLAATKVDQERAAAVVLLRQSPRGGEASEGMAALAYVNVGKGRTLAVLTDGLWQWAFLKSSQREFDSVYQFFWARAVRWLAAGGEFLPGQALSLSLDKLTAEPDEPVNVFVATRYPEARALSPRLRVRSPSGKVEEIVPAPVSEQSSRYAATLRPAEPGVHEIELVAPGADGAPTVRATSRLAVYDQSMEKLDPSARPQTLAELAQGTGGECLPVDQPQRLLQHLRFAAQARTSDRRSEYVFDRPAAVAIIVACFGIEWFLRRRWGLL